MNNPPHFITLVTKKRFPLFENPEAVKIFADALLKGQEYQHYQLLSFVFMPEHAHFLLIPIDNTISKIIQSYKSITYHLFVDRFAIKDKIWQRSFDNRIKDSVELLELTLAYIGNNPTKAGLSGQYLKYPYFYKNSLLIADIIKEFSPK